MLDWRPPEPFCRWLQRRQRRRRQYAQMMLRNAANEPSRRLAQRVIEDWGIDG